jgi:Ca-activated chloride channel homolog
MRLPTNFCDRSTNSLGLSVLLISLLCISLPCSDSGQAKAQSGSTSNELNVQTPRIRVDSDLVLIPVTVTDRKGTSVLGLEKDNFRLFEDRVEQEIIHFSMEDAPASIGLLFDSSASMGSKLLKSREAVARLLDVSRMGDEFFLVRFNNRVDLSIGFTQQAEEIQQQLTFVHPYGQTALLDATIFSIRQMESAQNARKALVIISDGGDNCSRYTLSDLKQMVQEADVQIYVMGIFDSVDTRSRSIEEMEGPALLRKIAEQSGGRLFEITNVDQLPEVASKIGQALRQQYVLAYSPSNRRRDGKYHHVEVKLTPSSGSSRLRASWRRGYYAPTD